MSSAFPMNFRLTADEQIRAAIIGVPAWSRRLREIEDRLLVARTRIREARDGGVGAAKLAELVAEHLLPINDLIERHNRFYPVEANLPLDPRTGMMLERITHVPWKPMPLLTAADLDAPVSPSAPAR